MVTHWKVVSMASMMLSKLVIPWFGPVHFSRQIDSLFLVRAMVCTMQFARLVNHIISIYVVNQTYCNLIISGFAIFVTELNHGIIVIFNSENNQFPGCILNCVLILVLFAGPFSIYLISYILSRPTIWSLSYSDCIQRKASIWVHC